LTPGTVVKTLAMLICSAVPRATWLIYLAPNRDGCGLLRGLLGVAADDVNIVRAVAAAGGQGQQVVTCVGHREGGRTRCAQQRKAARGQCQGRIIVAVEGRVPGCRAALAADQQRAR